MNTVSLKKEKAVSDKAKVILESPTPLPKGTTVLGCFQFSVLCILKNIDDFILYPLFWKLLFSPPGPLQSLHVIQSCLPPF